MVQLCCICLDMPNKFYHTAENLILRHSGRATAGRIGILATLLAEEKAITHREIEQRLPQSLQLDRVTLYRTLEWLVENGLIHKITSDDRIWRYHANPEPHSHQ